ncbi:MAG: radical SAM protein [Leptospiraceae bacterium]|nr:radical SAM protein [Leptospiraceae bacterium]
MREKVLIVTGGLITSQENSIREVGKKIFFQWKNSKAAWLDRKVKITMAEPLFAFYLEQFYSFFSSKKIPGLLKKQNWHPPSLTEVILATLLQKEGIEFESMEIGLLFSNPKKANYLIQNTGCVFLSTTYLHDLSELEPIVKRFKQKHNKIVLGGALTSILYKTWKGMAEVDLVAVGYGELLLPSIANWIKSNFTSLQTLPYTNLIHRQHSMFLISQTPESRNLDFLETPNWSLFEQNFNTIYYESVRGCPYRCSFCNYPYLFNDKTFRFKSAKRIADDWEYYSKELGITNIICLDSLFTIPRERLLEFCKILIQKKLPIKWTCYARADDLAKEEIVSLMKESGASQVQIGIESGDATILKNMNKACNIETNHQALINCRKHKLTTAASLIIGYPGETNQTIQNTYNFLEKTPPDFYFLALFSTRIPNVPILNPENKKRFSLKVNENQYSMAPYWKHSTMFCLEATNHLRRLDFELMQNKVSLNSVLFYKTMSEFHFGDRGWMLDLQKRVANHTILRMIFDAINLWVDKKLQQDLDVHLS